MKGGKEMLEILGLMMLCNKNKANALARGRKPTGFIWLTVLLWFGLEITGGIIGVAAEMGTGAYFLALLFALIGGLISYLASKNCKPGNYVPDVQILTCNIAQNAQPLDTPAQIVLVRESSMVGMAVNWTFSLNGKPVGSLGNGKCLPILMTPQRQNILRAADVYGTEIKPFLFDVESGSVAEIHFKTNKFLPEHSRGILPPTVPGTPAAAGQPAFCFNCGAPLKQGAHFCPNCGADLTAAPQFNR
jgi:hypothetical protein